MCIALTRDTPVRCFEVGGEILGARMNDVANRADTELAPSQPGAGLVEQVGDVSRTTKVPVVTCHAPTNPLSSVPRLVDNDHLIG